MQVFDDEASSEDNFENYEEGTDRDGDGIAKTWGSEFPISEEQVKAKLEPFTSNASTIKVVTTHPSSGSEEAENNCNNKKGMCSKF